jgi:hypothetical protein
LAANAICLIAAGVVRASLPASEFTLAWEHSVEKTRWEELYRIDGGKLALVEARVRGMGAGMEPAPDARFADGWWIWRPAVAPLRTLRLAASSYAPDYELCWNGRCSPLGGLLGPSPPEAAIELKACTGSPRTDRAGQPRNGLPP